VPAPLLPELAAVDSSSEMSERDSPSLELSGFKVRRFAIHKTTLMKNACKNIAPEKNANRCCTKSGPARKMAKNKANVRSDDMILDCVAAAPTLPVAWLSALSDTSPDGSGCDEQPLSKAPVNPVRANRTLFVITIMTKMIGEAK
jgi:hypothetical protein